MSIFPTLAPEWVDNYKPPYRAMAEQEYQDKGRSIIRLSNISTSGEITAFFNKLSPQNSQVLWDFWTEVEMVDSFTLPQGFFRFLHPTYEKRFRAISPTGVYRFVEEPKETRLRNCLTQIEMRFRGDII